MHSVSRYATAWAESLEAKLKRRLQLWEAGEVHDLVGRILGQQHTGQ